MMDDGIESVLFNNDSTEKRVREGYCMKRISKYPRLQNWQVIDIPGYEDGNYT